MGFYSTKTSEEKRVKQLTGDIHLSEEFKEEMTADDAIKIAAWCGEHVNNFFMKKLRNQELLMKKNEAQYTARANLLKQLGVIPNSNDKKESSSPSENG